MNPWIVLLQQDQTGAAQPAVPMWPMFVGLLFIFIVMMYLPQRKEQKRRAAMLAGIKKHDRILLNCGLYGTVVALDEQSVSVKVDDSSNVRMRFTRSAIAGIVSGDATDAKAAVEASNTNAQRS